MIKWLNKCARVIDKWSMGVPGLRLVTWQRGTSCRDPFLAKSFSCPKLLPLALCMCLVAQLCPTLCDPMPHKPPGSSLHRISTVGCHFLLQRISPTRGSNLCSLHCRWILDPLSHWESSPWFCFYLGTWANYLTLLSLAIFYLCKFKCRAYLILL